jgi:hypothetical protein
VNLISSSATTGQGLVAVQTVLHERYRDELETGLVARGHEAFHVVVAADADEVRRRIDADAVEVTANVAARVSARLRRGAGMAHPPS